MKNELNLIIIALVVSAFSAGCNNSGNNNKTLNKSNVAVVKNANSAAATNRVSTPAATAAPQADSKLNVANFEKMEKGMKYADVVKLLGSEGEVISDGEMSGIRTVMYKWSGANGAFLKAIFQNGKLIDKVHTGLY